MSNKISLSPFIYLEFISFNDFPLYKYKNKCFNCSKVSGVNDNYSSFELKLNVNFMTIYFIFSTLRLNNN